MLCLGIFWGAWGSCASQSQVLFAGGAESRGLSCARGGHSHSGMCRAGRFMQLEKRLQGQMGAVSSFLGIVLGECKALGELSCTPRPSSCSALHSQANAPQRNLPCSPPVEAWALPASVTDLLFSWNFPPESSALPFPFPGVSLVQVELSRGSTARVLAWRDKRGDGTPQAGH